MVIRHYPFVFSYRPVYGYVVLLVMLLAMSWENAQNNAAIVEGAIPEESIRIRILANSDSAADQAVKRHVRNAIADELRQLSAGADSIAEAREAIAGALPELETMVKRELEMRGFDYPAAVKLGPVPFPAKIYGNRVYPAGQYEALLITLGEGKGENWWCVLFPPLCFADAVGAGKADKGEAVTNDAAGSGAKEASAFAAQDAQDGGVKAGASQKVEVKFAVWELLQRIADFFKRLFG
ncbi:MAG: stage II sporulation protein R [Paenibacillaceae bacterium]|nr:MAG: stage II sporulation protein R [Paenibacillaceae bacterium]